jgi:hypothetical protein
MRIVPVGKQSLPFGAEYKIRRKENKDKRNSGKKHDQSEVRPSGILTVISGTGMGHKMMMPKIEDTCT